MTGSETKLLDGLASQAKAVSAQKDSIPTESFTTLIDHMLPLFNFLGTALSFAKSEMNEKLTSLKEAQATKKLLAEIVAADKEAGTITKKGSTGRNLHRLMTSLLFVKILLEKLLENTSTSLKDAASAAYEASLAPIHTFVVKTAIRTGMMTLPSRQSFLEHLGETEESAKEVAVQIIEHAAAVIAALERLFDGVEMPASNFKFSLW